MTSKYNKLLWLALAAGLTIRLAGSLWHIGQGFTWPDEPEYARLASNLPWFTYAVSGLPVVQRGPTYTLFMSLFYYVFGNAVVPTLVVQALLGVATALLLARSLGRALRRGGARDLVADRAEVLAAAALALSPYAILYDRLLLTESLATFLLAVSVVAWNEARYATGRPFRMRWAAACGFALGAAVLIKPVLLLLPPLLFGLEFILDKRSRCRERVAVIALTALVAAATIAPWTVRNAIVSGHFIPVSIGGGFFLYEGTLPTNGSGVPIPDGDPEELSLDRLAAADGSLEWMIQTDRRLRSEAVAKIKARPLEFAKLVAHRVVRFWATSHASALVPIELPVPVRAAFAFFSAALFLLAMFGLMRLGSAPFVAALPIALVPLYFTTVHNLIGSGARYSVPAWPFVLCLAAYAVASLSRRPAA